MANKATSEVIRYFVKMAAKYQREGMYCKLESAVHDEDANCSRVTVSFRVLDASNKAAEKLCDILRLASAITILDDDDGVITLVLTIPDEEE